VFKRGTEGKEGERREKEGSEETRKGIKKHKQKGGK
jgi:hypothetical protein